MSKLDYNFKMRCDDNLFISVFNVHTNELKRAEKSFRIIYGLKKFKDLKKFIKDNQGLMAIFNVEPTDELTMFALLITQAQNQRKD